MKEGSITLRVCFFWGTGALHNNINSKYVVFFIHYHCRWSRQAEHCLKILRESMKGYCRLRKQVSQCVRAPMRAWLYVCVRACVFKYVCMLKKKQTNFALRVQVELWLTFLCTDLIFSCHSCGSCVIIPGLVHVCKQCRHVQVFRYQWQTVIGN